MRAPQRCLRELREGQRTDSPSAAPYSGHAVGHLHAAMCAVVRQQSPRRQSSAAVAADSAAGTGLFAYSSMHDGAFAVPALAYECCTALCKATCLWVVVALPRDASCAADGGCLAWFVAVERCAASSQMAAPAAVAGGRSLPATNSDDAFMNIPGQLSSTGENVRAMCASTAIF